MDWYICEKTEDEYLNRTAGIKAREDLDVIFKQCGMKMINLVVGEDTRTRAGVISKIMGHIAKKKYWEEKLACVHEGDTIYIQFPVRNHTVFLASVLKKLVQKNIRVVLFIHDLEYMRHIKNKSIPFKKKKRMELEEVSVLKNATNIVVHNHQMKKLMHEALGIPSEKMIELDIFDYLIGKEGEKIEKRGKRKQGYSCIIAGNLDKQKSAYVYELPKDIAFDLYGPNYTGQAGGNICYHGSFPPAELPYELEGNFGLVWDGISVDTCAGVYGEYLKVNNPHKTSLYLASGIPVIIWKEAALAEFVEQERVGITISSLYEIKDIFEKLTEDEYADMLQHAKLISKRLTSGFYTKQAIEKAMK